MNVELDGGWTATNEHRESRDGELVYIPPGGSQGDACALREALQAGMLESVRNARGLTREAVARQIGVTPNGVHRWARGETCPKGLYRDALERWLTGRKT